MSRPSARSASPFIGKIGLPVLASALGCGIFAGYVFVIPGLAAISIAGLLDIRLGDWLVYGVEEVAPDLDTLVAGIVFVPIGLDQDEVSV